MAHSIVTSTARLWLDEDGLIHLRPHALREQTLADAIENVAAAKQIRGDAARALLVHFHDEAPQTTESRAYYLSPDASRGLLAVAVMTGSVLGRIFGNLMIGASRGEVPVKLFDDEASASLWLRAQSACRGAPIMGGPPPESMSRERKRESARTPR